MTPLRFLVLVWILAFPRGMDAARVIHVFVALADNAHQGIVPVPAKIGDRDRPDDNLYWGCDEGVRAWFSRSSRWKKLGAVKSPRPEILERVLFRHREKEVYLIADAWRGSDIEACTVTFAKAAAGEGSENVPVGDQTVSAGGAADLVAYIGHNGLMDFAIEWPEKEPDKNVSKPAIVLCCISNKYFGPPLKAVGARPLLLTTQLMYPGAFVLHEALEAWLGGGGSMALREAAARAYAKNQDISVKAAAGVFTGPP